jgi:hypothetical protein
MKQDPEFWDARPLLALQREVEFLTQIDLREFAERFPWTEDDLATKRVSVVLSVRKVSCR